jgi:predicted SAM-dependent methyltransferase
MINQYIKDLYYLSAAKLSILSYGYNKLFPSKSFHNASLNIGCGPKYIDGMVNIDGNIFRKKDLWLDVTIGLPFADNSIEAIYVSHMLEHLNSRNLRKLLKEFYRVLKSDGLVRIVVPSLEYAIQSYTNNHTKNLPEWPENFSSAGGKFNNFMLCGNQHFLMFDFSFLEELLKDAGFDDIVRLDKCISNFFTERHLYYEKNDQMSFSSLYIECYKVG